jgi:hypothetical protein
MRHHTTLNKSFGAKYVNRLMAQRVTVGSYQFGKSMKI